MGTSKHYGRENFDPCEWVWSSLDTDLQFSPNYIRSCQWTVLPMESALHFDKKAAEAVAAAASAFGKDTLLAVLAEKLENVFPSLMTIPANTEGLLSFSKQCAHFSYVLLPDDASFAVVCNAPGGYLLLGGPRKFVEIAAGKDLSSARLEFETFAMEDPDQSRNPTLLDIHKMYCGT